MKRLAVMIAVVILLTVIIVGLSNDKEYNKSQYVIKVSSGSEPKCWSDDIRLTHNIFESSYPTFTVDSHNNIHIVWMDDRNGDFEIYYKKIDRDGKVLIGDTRLTYNHSNSYLPAIVSDSDDNNHVVWIDDRDGNWILYYKKVDNTGDTLVGTMRIAKIPRSAVLLGTFSLLSHTKLSKDDLENSRALITAINFKPSIAIDSKDDVYVLWSNPSDGDFEIYYTKLSKEGDVLIEEVKLTNTDSDSHNPAMAVDRDDDLHIVWSEDRDDGSALRYMKLSPFGEKLVKETTFLNTTLDSSFEPSIDVDGDGNVYVVWEYERLNVNRIYYTKLDDNGSTIIDDKCVTPSNLECSNPSISVDSDGNARIVWQAKENKNSLNWDLYYLMLDSDGGKVDENSPLTKATLSSLRPAIKLINNSSAVIWYDNREGNYEIYYKVEIKTNSERTNVKESIESENSFPIIAVAMLVLAGLCILPCSKKISLSAFLPLYSRIKGKKLLDHSLRENIYKLILKNPGINFTSLMKMLNVKNGVLAYHLKILEREEMIKSRRDGLYRRFYPEGVRDLPREIRENPGITLSKIAKMTNRSNQLINHHTKILAEQGRLILRKKGRNIECYVKD